MSLDQELKNKVQDAIKGNKLDFWLRKTLFDVLKSEDSSKLNDVVAYLVQAKEGLSYKGLNNIHGNYYTARTTYKELVEWANSQDFYIFESSQKLRPN